MKLTKGLTVGARSPYEKSRGPSRPPLSEGLASGAESKRVGLGENQLPEKPESGMTFMCENDEQVGSCFIRVFSKKIIITHPKRDSSLEDSFRMTKHIHSLLLSS